MPGTFHQNFWTIGATLVVLSRYASLAPDAGETRRKVPGTVRGIDDSVIVLELNDRPHPTATPSQVYIYVKDVDQDALAAGATPLSPPADQPHCERNSGIRDVFGNIFRLSQLLS